MKSIVSFEDFQKIDLRIGKVTKAERKEGSENLLRLTVYFGDEIGERNILSGISQWYTPDDILKKKFIFTVNLKPMQMMGEESQGMIVCAVKEDGAPIILPVNDNIPEGTVVR